MGLSTTGSLDCSVLKMSGSSTTRWGQTFQGWYDVEVGGSWQQAAREPLQVSVHLIYSQAL